MKVILSLGTRSRARCKEEQARQYTNVRPEERYATHLNDMVALSVASALEDVPVELPDEADLLVDENVFESLGEVDREVSHDRGT